MSLFRRRQTTRRTAARRSTMPTACFVTAVRIGNDRTAAAEMRREVTSGR